MSSSSSYSVYVDLKLNTKDFDSSISNVNKKLGGLGNTANSAGSKMSAKWSAVMGAIGGVTASVFNKVTSTITGSIGDAVKRFDTMNNFPKVMKNLGISTADSKKALESLAASIKGLPTTLDGAAMGVQRLTSKNGDVQKSTKLFLAMNNAILAGGAGADIQSSAIEQLSQAYAKGKPDMMEWRTMLMAMPAQLNQVAKAMGYVDADALGEDLRSGRVSMEDFMNTIVKLNSEGINGLGSFEEQARAAIGGIGTALVNARTAVVRGVAGVIQAFGGSDLNAIITGVGDAFERFLGKISGAISFIKENIGTIGAFTGAIVGMGAALASAQIVQGIQNLTAISKLGLGFGQTMSAMSSLGGVSGAIGQLGGSFAGLGKAIGSVFNIIKGNPIIAIIGLIVGALTIFFTKTETGGKMLEQIMGTISGLFEKLTPVIDAVMQAVQPLLDMVMEGFAHIAEAFAPIAQIVMDLLSQIMEALAPLLPVFADIIRLIGQALAPVLTVIAGIIAAIVPVLAVIIRAISEIVSTVLTIAMPAIKVIASAISLAVKTIVAVISTIVGTVRTVFDFVWNFIKGVIDKIGGGFNNMVNGVKSVFQGIANTVSSVFGAIAGVVRGVINGVIGGINAVIDTINSVKVPDWVPGIGGASANISHIAYLASGGIVEARRGGTPVILGEGGQNEWVVPESKMADMIAKLGGGVGGTKVVQNNTINTPVDLQVMNQRLGNAVRRATA